MAIFCRPPCAVVAATVLAALLLVAPARAGAGVVWLCSPGVAGDACATRLTTTTFSPDGRVQEVQRLRPAARRRADCFYVYPTVSDQLRPQATRVVDDVLRSIAHYQAARFTRDCRVFAPVYRQITVRGVLQPATVTERMREQGYADVRAAWRTYLRRDNEGRGVVLIGHSQGTFVLRRLIRTEIDRRPSVRRRLVSALLLGGDVTVRRGRDRGGDFANVPACRSPRQTGCVVAFSAYAAPVPEDALFGRTVDPSLEVLCTNPAALGGGSGSLTAIFPTRPFAPSLIGTAMQASGAGLPPAATPWTAFPGSYTARCSNAAGPSVLEVTAVPGARPIPAVPDARWGLHLADANVALGNLADLVRRQIAAYAAR